VIRALALAAALVLTACGPDERAGGGEALNPPAAGQPASPPEPAVAGPAAAPEARTELVAVLTPEGYGPVRIGMTEAEALRALGPGAGGASGASDDCHHLSTGPQPANLLYMVERGKVTRVTIHRDSTVKTDRGIGVGDTAQQVQAAYPGLVVEPHKYVEGAQSLTAWTVPDSRGVRFETDAKGVVTDVHAGDATIQYVEGCS
jgi:hypothetical protein